MQLESPVFEQYQEIPARFTCDGEDLSPPLLFRNTPKGVQSYALIVEDPDAPRGIFDHWIAWNIPAEAPGLPEGNPAPREGMNGFGSKGYRGPCPPQGKPHRYFFRLFALDTILSLPMGASKKELIKAMEGHILSQAELVGTYTHNSSK